jgi:hypothetical protein
MIAISSTFSYGRWSLGLHKEINKTNSAPAFFPSGKKICQKEK